MPLDPPQDAGQEFWHNFLTNGDSKERRMRSLFAHLPSEPRCHLCGAPFAGPAAPFMRILDKGPSQQSPKTCNQCYSYISTHHGGAEVELTMLFADIRGSTTIAEGMSPGAFRELLDRFYSTASRIVFEYDGSLDKFVGDELVAIFFPLITGPDHAIAAVRAAEALLRATGHEDDGAWNLALLHTRAQNAADMGKPLAREPDPLRLWLDDHGSGLLNPR